MIQSKPTLNCATFNRITSTKWYAKPVKRLRDLSWVCVTHQIFYLDFNQRNWRECTNAQLQCRKERKKERRNRWMKMNSESIVMFIFTNMYRTNKHAREFVVYLFRYAFPSDFQVNFDNTRKRKKKRKKKQTKWKVNTEVTLYTYLHTSMGIDNEINTHQYYACFHIDLSNANWFSNDVCACVCTGAVYAQAHTILRDSHNVVRKNRR